MKQSFKTKLRQLWFPKAFRLPEPEFSKDQIDLLEELIQLIQPTISQVEATSRDERVHMAHFLVGLGTGIWRIRRKIEGLSRMPKEIRDALYSLESTWMSMSEGGVEIVDHIGTIPSKNEAKVVEVRDIPNLAREQVVDAVKPTILLRGEVIQLGEVIMGRPVKNGSEPVPPVHAQPIVPDEIPDEQLSFDSREVHDNEEDEDAQTVAHEVETLTIEPSSDADEDLADRAKMADAAETPDLQDEPEAVAIELAEAESVEPAEKSWIEDFALPEEPEFPGGQTDMGDKEDAPDIPEAATEETATDTSESVPDEHVALSENENIEMPEPSPDRPESISDTDLAAAPELPLPEADRADEKPEEKTLEKTDDVPDVPPAPKAKRKKAPSRVKAAGETKTAKTAKKTKKTETADIESAPEPDGVPISEDTKSAETAETQQVRKPARPKRKRPPKPAAMEPVENGGITEVDVDG